MVSLNVLSNKLVKEDAAHDNRWISCQINLLKRTLLAVAARDNRWMSCQINLLKRTLLAVAAHDSIYIDPHMMDDSRPRSRAFALLRPRSTLEPVSLAAGQWRCFSANASKLRPNRTYVSDIRTSLLYLFVLGYLAYYCVHG